AFRALDVTFRGSAQGHGLRRKGPATVPHQPLGGDRTWVPRQLRLCVQEHEPHHPSSRQRQDTLRQGIFCASCLPRCPIEVRSLSSNPRQQQAAAARPCRHADRARTVKRVPGCDLQHNRPGKAEGTDHHTRAGPSSCWSAAAQRYLPRCDHANQGERRRVVVSQAFAPRQITIFRLTTHTRDARCRY
ncbi:hypothetical protein C8Q80DRAFT_1356061, partial [Daedaleopsis nitida]